MYSVDWWDGKGREGLTRAAHVRIVHVRARHHGLVAAANAKGEVRQGDMARVRESAVAVVVDGAADAVVVGDDDGGGEEEERGRCVWLPYVCLSQFCAVCVGVETGDRYVPAMESIAVGTNLPLSMA